MAREHEGSLMSTIKKATVHWRGQEIEVPVRVDDRGGRDVEVLDLNGIVLEPGESVTIETVAEYTLET